jgi:hypothetical protein
MFSFGLVDFGLVYIASFPGSQARLKIFNNHPHFRRSQRFPFPGIQIKNWQQRSKNTTSPVRTSISSIFMRIKFFTVLVLLGALTGGAFGAVVVEKRSREMPYVEVCEGVNSFLFRGPKGTSRKPILVPSAEYWAVHEAGIYSFVLRYESGRVCSRLVTPEVFARYKIGEDYYDRLQTHTDSYETEDSKTVQPAAHHHHRTDTAQLRKKKHSSHRTAAKHRRHHRARMVAQR